jgi:HK97 gp10 family phage protein
MNIFASASFRPGDVARIQEQVTARNIRATTNATQRVLDSALEKCPISTEETRPGGPHGELQQSGHMTVTVEGQVVRGSVIFDAPHAGYVEFGTGIRGAASAGAGPYPYNPTWPGMPAQPYVRPALDENRDAIISEYRAA